MFRLTAASAIIAKFARFVKCQNFLEDQPTTLSLKVFFSGACACATEEDKGERIEDRMPITWLMALFGRSEIQSQTQHQCSLQWSSQAIWASKMESLCSLHWSLLVWSQSIRSRTSSPTLKERSFALISKRSGSFVHPFLECVFLYYIEYIRRKLLAGHLMPGTKI